MSIIVNAYFWIFIALNFISYLLYRNAQKSNGNKNVILEFTGGALILASFLLMFLIVGWQAGLLLIPIFWFAVTPVVELVIDKYRSPKSSHKVYADKFRTLNQLKRHDPSLGKHVLLIPLPENTLAPKGMRISFVECRSCGFNVEFLPDLYFSIFFYCADKSCRYYKRGHSFDSPLNGAEEPCPGCGNVLMEYDLSHADLCPICERGVFEIYLYDKNENKGVEKSQRSQKFLQALNEGSQKNVSYR